MKECGKKGDRYCCGLDPVRARLFTGPPKTVEEHRVCAISTAMFFSVPENG